MANQIPYAIGLEEAVEQQMCIWLSNLVTNFTGQQPDQKVHVSVASLYNKLEAPSYPFIGVRAHLPSWEPSNIGDFESVDLATGSPAYSKINECLINLHFETKEYRQLQRLYSFLQLQLEFGWDNTSQPGPDGYESWLSQIRNWGLVINGWTANPYYFVEQTDEGNNNNRKTYPRTDVDTLWQRDVNLNCMLQTRVIFMPNTFISEIDTNLTIILPAP